MGRTMGDLDLRKVEVFYWVAELKSFSAAAGHLSLRQPTVSAHVHELEKKLGAKLLNRLGGKIAPTPLGQVLFDSAKRLLALKRDTLASLDQFHGKVRGELRVGGSNIPGEYVLPPKLAAFAQKYPEVKPFLRIGDSAGIVEGVLDGDVESGLVRRKARGRRRRLRHSWSC